MTLTGSYSSTKPSKAPESLTDNSTGNATQLTVKREQLANIYRQSLFSLIVHILKTLSSKTHPLSVPDITAALLSITQQSYNVNTVRRHLSSMIEIFAADESSEYIDMKNAFISCYGGIIHEIDNSIGVNMKNTYYFEPLLSAGDVNMLCACVTSNRYMSSREKEYLNAGIKTLSPYYSNTIPALDNSMLHNMNKKIAMDEIINSNAKNLLDFQKNNIYNTTHSSGKAPKNNHLLDIIQSLDHATRERKQIIIRYGIYTYDDTRLNHLKLTDRKKEYTLNPYALCWNNGSYYLICTNKGHHIPFHFRVDRILDIIITNEKCETRPDTLKPFFKGKDFLVDKYTATHPYMSIYDEKDRVDCIFEISAGALSILVDYFGENIRLEKTDMNTVDVSGNTQPVFKAEIKDVEYPCLKLFTIQHHHLLRVLSPGRLIDDLKFELSKSLEKY